MMMVSGPVAGVDRDTFSTPSAGPADRNHRNTRVTHLAEKRTGDVLDFWFEPERG